MLGTVLGDKKISNQPNKPKIQIPAFLEFTIFSSPEKPREACFDPGNIMNGTRIGTDFKLGSTVTYQCDSGYKIVDPSSITCVIGADGKPAWNRVLPSCNGTLEPVLFLWKADSHFKNFTLEYNIPLISG